MENKLNDLELKLSELQTIQKEYESDIKNYKSMIDSLQTLKQKLEDYYYDTNHKIRETIYDISQEKSDYKIKGIYDINIPHNPDVCKVKITTSYSDYDRRTKQYDLKFQIKYKYTSTNAWRKTHDIFEKDLKQYIK